MGTEDEVGGFDDDALRRLLESPATEVPREPSAEERARDAERRRRSQDLARRLADEEAAARQAEQQARRQERRARRRSNVPRRLGVAAFAVLVVGVAAVASGLVALPGWVTGTDVAAPAEPIRPAGFPPAAEPAATTRLAPPVTAPAAGGQHAFMSTQPGRSEVPVRYDPCRPVRYVVNPTGAPAGTETLVTEAVAAVAAATGLVFEPAGTTDEQPAKERESYQPDRYGPRWAPVLISWSDATQTPGLAGYIAGLGGSTAVGLDDGPLVYVTGSVVLDRDDLQIDPTVPGSADGVRAVIQHELGHLVGLDHVSSPSELMYTEGVPGQTAWGPGDLTGLAIAGAGPCAPEL